MYLSILKCKRKSWASSSSVPSQCEDVLLVQWELHVSVKVTETEMNTRLNETEQKQETQTSFIEKKWKL